MRLIDADELLRAYDKAHEGQPGKARKLIEDAPTVGGWISVEDRLPESGEHVLAVCEIRPIRHPSHRYICEAFYAEKYSISDVGSEDEISYDYNEEEDEYYLKEGWYECVHNWDEYSSIVIGDFVTHWMPLPDAPK